MAGGCAAAAAFAGADIVLFPVPASLSRPGVTRTNEYRTVSSMVAGGERWGGYTGPSCSINTKHTTLPTLCWRSTRNFSVSTAYRLRDLHPLLTEVKASISIPQLFKSSIFYFYYLLFKENSRRWNEIFIKHSRKESLQCFEIFYIPISPQVKIYCLTLICNICWRSVCWIQMRLRFSA